MGFKGSDSCYEKAAADEPIFVLRAKDILAPAIVREWCRLLVERMGGNFMTMPKGQRDKINEALTCAEAMENWGQRNQTKVPD